jgi:DNA-binding transcriptional MerR regulator
MKNGGANWTIDELTSAVARALAEGYDGAPSGRVRDVPDRRTIRYYTTLGLIDRPAEMRGRTALYNRRHLLQIVAIKKLQAVGRSLAEIQKSIAGQTDKALAQFAGLDQLGPEEGAERPAAMKAAREFWREPPAVYRPPRSEPAEDGAGPSDATPPAEPARPRPFLGVPLVEGLTLLLASRRPIDDEDLNALRIAAAPLIRTLTRLQLIDSSDGGETP